MVLQIRSRLARYVVETISRVICGDGCGSPIALLGLRCASIFLLFACAATSVHAAKTYSDNNDGTVTDPTTGLCGCVAPWGSRGTEALVPERRLPTIGINWLLFLAH